MIPGFDFFRRHREYGVIFLRLIIGAFIIWGVQDNVLSYEHMKEFAAFLGERGVPMPLFAAFLSAYTQMVCGICILLGAATRLVSIPFIINCPKHASPKLCTFGARLSVATHFWRMIEVVPDARQQA